MSVHFWNKADDQSLIVVKNYATKTLSQNYACFSNFSADLIRVIDGPVSRLLFLAGLIFATMLTMVVVPVLYATFYKAKTV